MRNMTGAGAPWWAVVVLSVATGVLGTVALRPSPAEAVAGMSLMDRVLLSGTPRSYYVERCNDPNAPVVPEGKRLFINELRYFRAEVADGVTARLGGRALQYSREIPSNESTNRDWASISAGLPFVLEGGTPIRIECTRGDGAQENANIRLFIQDAYEL